MAKVENTRQDEAQLCSLDGFRKMCSANPRILLIFSKEDRKGFAQKFIDEAAPKDLAVAVAQTGGPCEVVEKLGVKDTSTALLIEKGEVTSRITLANDDVKDTAGLIKMLSEKTPSESCKTELIVNGKGWKLKTEPSPSCERALNNIDKLGRDAKKHLQKHIMPDG